MPRLSAASMNSFADLNPNRLTLEIGRLTTSGLKESWLTAKAREGELSTQWKEIAKKLRASTHTGVQAINPNTGKRSQLKSHRYTSGALAIQECGHAILPAAGNAIIRLGINQR